MINNYLEHSSRGTHWEKKEHDYNKKVKKRYYYEYETLQKMLWKAKKQGNSEKASKLKADLDDKRKAKAYSHIAKSYNKVAEMTGSSEVKTKANEYQRRANDIIPKHTKQMKIIDITSDMINRGKMILYNLLKRK